MSRTQGNPADRPIRGPSLYPQDEGPCLAGRNLGSFYRNFFDLIDVMAVMFDDRGIVRLFNRKACNLTGYAREEVLGHDLFALLPEEGRDRGRELLLGGLRQGIRHMELPLPLMVKAGGILPVCWSLSLVRDDDGNAFGLFGLGFVPASPDMPCLALGRQMDNYRASVGAMTHDLLNHSQVVLGYLELAIEQSDGNEKLRCMLDRATSSMAKCGNVAANVHKLITDRPDSPVAPATAVRSE